ncbi:MAG: hypothetical protein GF409_06425 [Candidatus Omnitrophica bacterium]|nr:hypothetical protein [Candidatus Omnitrophota bacterium]
MIQIRENNEHEFTVTVEESDGKTEYTVGLDNAYYRDLTGGNITRKELIRKSFEFLLEREPNSSILTRFDLRAIRDYFPGYEKTISNG